MASGSEPHHISLLLAKLRPICSGVSLCGAGAGGFAVVVLKREFGESRLRNVVADINCANKSSSDDTSLVSVHRVTLDWNGIQM